MPDVFWLPNEFKKRLQFTLNLFLKLERIECFSLSRQSVLGDRLYYRYGMAKRAAQQALLKRARLNCAAQRGEYLAAMELAN